jgi:hypothetical protein
MDADWAKTYAAMDDGELVALAAESDELVEEARNALWSELQRRGLEQEAAAAYNPRPRRPAPLLRPTDSLATVAVFTKLWEAALARTKLESAGIRCFLAEEHIVRMDWFLLFAVGHIKLQVNEADLLAASDLLADAGIRSEVELAPGDGEERVLPRWLNLKTMVWLILIYSVFVWALVTMIPLLAD